MDRPVNDSRPVVAFLTHSAQLSGAELFLLRVTAAMRRIRPLVVLGEHGPLERALVERGVDVEVVELPTTVRSHTGQSRGGATIGKSLGVVATVRRTARVLRARRVAAVTTHSAKAHLYGGLAGRLIRVPVVAHLHGVLGTADVHRANTVLLRTVLRTLPSAVIANSRCTARSLGGRAPVTVVGCPVSIPPHTPVASSDVVVVGRLSAFKGQDVAIRAFARATAGAAGPTAPRLRIAGAALFPRDAAYADGLRALADQLGVADRVDFLGHVTDVSTELANAGIAVHASPLPEGFGQVVVEAMAAGRPVIASAAGGPAELIEDGVDGLLVPPGDDVALAAAIGRLVDDTALGDRLGAAARVSARRFGLDGIVGELEEALLRACR